MKKITISILVSVFLSGQAVFSANQIENEIRDVLRKQQEAWNHNNIKEFMKYYWNSPELTFQSGNNRVTGWEALLARYQRNYSGDKIGKLEFKDLSIKILSGELAYVLGRYHLSYDDKSPEEGLFTILLMKKPEGWRIIHDHTSS